MLCHQVHHTDALLSLDMSVLSHTRSTAQEAWPRKTTAAAEACKIPVWRPSTYGFSHRRYDRNLIATAKPCCQMREIWRKAQIGRNCTSTLLAGCFAAPYADGGSYWSLTPLATYSRSVAKRCFCSCLGSIYHECEGTGVKRDPRQVFVPVL